MQTRIFVSVVIAVWAGAAVGCGGATGNTPPAPAPRSSSPSLSTATPPTPMQNTRPAPLPPPNVNREIIPLLDPIPAPLTDGERLSEDPAEIRREVARLLAEGNNSEALPLIDVMLILDPSDLEMMELRGRILLGQGFDEDGTTDLERCCKMGRETCCQ